MSTKKEHKVKTILLEKLEELKSQQNKRLDEIELFVREELKKINDRSRAVNGFIINEVKVMMDNKLYNLELTVEAIKNTLEEKLNIDGFSSLVDKRRAAVHERITKREEENMKSSMEQKKEQQ